MPLRLIFAAAALCFAGVAGGAIAAERPAAGGMAPDPAPFFSFNQNRFSYSYIFTATNPGSGNTAKSVFSFTHIDAWAYGTNLVNVDVLKSDTRDPIRKCEDDTCPGATEIYGFFRSTVGLNELFGTKAFSFGPLRNVSLEIGGDANFDNNSASGQKRSGVVGVQLNFGLPYGGILNVAALAYKEINHNEFLKPVFNNGIGVWSGDADFRPTWSVEANYHMDLGFLPAYLPLSLSGRAALVGPKGAGTSISIPGNLNTKTEFNSEQRLTWDVSRSLWGPAQAHRIEVWGAYRYWQNKFGLDHTRSNTCTAAVDPYARGSCTEQSWVAGVSFVF
ncbi:hypothetical protein GCM10010994_33900 [Chelatococcus reniformis]|uniref:Outer membrane protein beta-barrel domain-containing protein n=2 Tax=Chelatococcus reniformis TaxID=1494448 RepID=A0A916XHM1_9HYPH|nr:hypothetical protein GCM10010994_33900 [Chelatococcus reniformis]